MLGTLQLARERAGTLLLMLNPAANLHAGHAPVPCGASQVGVHVLAPAEVLAADPLPDAVAVMQLAVAASAARSGGVQLPEGAGRLAVFIDGTESDEDLAALKVGCGSIHNSRFGQDWKILVKVEGGSTRIEGRSCYLTVPPTLLPSPLAVLLTLCPCPGAAVCRTWARCWRC